MKKRSLLWQISGMDLKAPCFLFGTMHVRDARILAILPEVRRRLALCEVFAAEYELDEGEPEALFQALLLPGNQSLRSFFSEKYYQKLQYLVLRETGQKLSLFDNRKPLFISNLLSEAQLGQEGEASMDELLHRFAGEEGLDLAGLESFSEQLQILQTLPIDEQVKPLKDAVRNFKRFRKHIQQSSESYLQGDLQTLLKQVKRSMGGMRRILLYERNRRMVDAFVQLAQHKKLFAAVGAAHLPGAKGMLRLLKKQGYQVQALALPEITHLH